MKSLKEIRDLNLLEMITGERYLSNEEKKILQDNFPKGKELRKIEKEVENF